MDALRVARIRRHGGLRAWLLACCGVCGVPAATASAYAPAEASRPGSGAISTSSTGRARVRGDRPEGASIHAAWTPPAVDPDRDDRDALAAFERKALPATIV